MCAKLFVDTNIFVYVLDAHDKKKQRRARKALEEYAQKATLVISTQVIQELYVASTNKLGVEPLQAKAFIKTLGALPKMVITPELIDDAIDVQILNKVSFWDALILATARGSGCSQLLTEDLNDGQIIAGVKVVNPFR